MDMIMFVVLFDIQWMYEWVCESIIYKMALLAPLFEVAVCCLVFQEDN